MEAITHLYYFAPGKRLTVLDVRRELSPVPETVVCQVFREVPRTVTFPREAVVVIDFDGLRTGEAPPDWADDPGVGTGPEFVAILARDSILPAAWLGFLRSPQTCLIMVPHSHHSIHPHAVAALRLRITGLQASIVKAVTASNPGLFWKIERIVQVLLEDPWGIRRPSDLAMALKITLPQLERRCAHLPLGRLEHVLTAVRWLAFQHLLVSCHFKVRAALQLVGIRDRSNLRRQWRRAAYLVSDTSDDRDRRAVV